MSTATPAVGSIEYSADHLGISVRLAKALTGAHRPMVVVKALTPRGKFYNIPVTTGAVTVDQTSKDFRRSINFVTNAVTVDNGKGDVTNVVPQNDYDPLNIYGQHIFAYRGVVWDLDNIDPDLWEAKPPLSPALLRPKSLAYELVPLGIFRINTVEVEEEEEAQIMVTVTGTDISNNISRNHWTNPVTVWNKKYTVPIAKTDTTPEQTYVANTVDDAIKILIRNRWPVRHPVFGEPLFDFAGIKNHVLESPVIMGATTVTSSGTQSPWTDISGLADAVGAQLYVDRNGKFALKTVPDPNSIPAIWKFLDGDGGLLISADRKLDDSKSMNYVIATGENSGVKGATSKSKSKPLKAVAYDADPNSPTYYLGEYGRVVGYEPGRKKLTTQSQVQNAADTYLNWFVGGEEVVTFSGICNPAIDVGQVVDVRRKRVGIFNNEATVCDLASDTGLKTLSKLLINPLKNAASAGDTLTLFSDAGTDNFVLSAHAPVGVKTLHVKPFKPKLNYKKGTAVLDAKVFTDGSVPYFIDKCVIPLENETPMQVTCRERRVGSKQDAVRVAEYSTGY